MKIYTIYDKVAEQTTYDVFTAVNHQTAIRQCLNWVAQRYPLKDVELQEIGKITEKGIIIAHEPNEIKFIKWNEYKFPETKAEALEPLNMTEDELNFVEKNHIMK